MYLSEQGIEEAKNAGLLLTNAGLGFDQVFTSTLLRANPAMTQIMGYETPEDLLKS